MSSDQQVVLDKQLKEKAELESKLHKAFQAIGHRKRFPPMFGNEVSSSNGTPCSDGKNVYWVCGGGMKGPGASVVCCFDLAGKRIWSYHLQKHSKAPGRTWVAHVRDADRWKADLCRVQESGLL